jgi:heterodisulfide reductase subunit A2
MKRIGVFLCWCGTNIGGVVDIAKAMEAVTNLPDVAHVEDNKYCCSEPGQEMIIKSIKEHNLDRVVVASCSPRMHEGTFRKALEKAGLNPYMFEMANIREHCSWVHASQPELATEKAIDLIRKAVAKVRIVEPLFEGSIGITKKALVIGGGIAGMQSAIDIADAGYEVILVERESTLGGRMAQLDKTFPTLDCSA